MITKEDFPKPLLVRGTQLDEESQKYKAITGHTPHRGRSAPHWTSFEKRFRGQRAKQARSARVFTSISNSVRVCA